MMNQTATRISIAVGKALGKFLEERPLRQDLATMTRQFNDDDYGREISESTALDRLAERYNFLLRQNFPKLPEEAWEAILNAYNPRSEHSLFEIHPVFCGVCDDLGLELQPDESNENFWKRVKKSRYGFISSISKLTDAENLVVHEFIERFWGRDQDEDNYEAISLRDQLAKFSGVSPGEVFAE